MAGQLDFAKERCELARTGEAITRSASDLFAGSIVLSGSLNRASGATVLTKSSIIGLI